MGSLNGRISRLEDAMGPTEPEDEGKARRMTVMRGVLNELAHLKGSGAVGYRGGVRVEPEDIPAKILGPDYTTAQVVELAIRRVFEREGIPEEQVATWMEFFERIGAQRGKDWQGLDDISE